MALVAGTAVRLLVTAFPRFRNRRRLRAHANAHQRAPKRLRHPHILALLDQRAPIIRADHWRRRNPETDCTFCLEAIRPSRISLRVTPCRHVFHASCLEQWVLYTADICLDWHQYSLSDDGSIKSSARHPSCPNCSADLQVVPHHLLKKVVLTSIARSLSLSDLSAAAEMYDAGLVYRAGPAHSAPSTRRRSVVTSAATSHSRNPQRYSRPVPRYVRQDSTVSEPPEGLNIANAHARQRTRHSLPEEMVASVPPPATGRNQNAHRAWRRSTSQLAITEHMSTARVVLQTPS